MIKGKTALTMGAVVSILLCTIAQAQEQGYITYYMFGGNIIDIRNLNSRLENKGYSKLYDNFFSWGGGGHRIIRKVIVGGESHTLIRRETTNRNYRTSIGGGYRLFNVGYLFYMRDGLNIYPILGLGRGNMSLKIIEIGTSSFDKALDSPKRSVELSTSSFLLNLALGTDYLLKLREDEKERCELIFALRIGYTFAPIKGDWEMDGIKIFGGPDVGITGPYIRLGIGGGFRKK